MKATAQRFAGVHRQALAVGKITSTACEPDWEIRNHRFLQTQIGIAIFNWGLFLNPVQHVATQVLGLAQGVTVMQRQEREWEM